MTDTRATQGGVYVGVVETPDVRATQGGLYVGTLKAADFVRGTQAGVYVGVMQTLDIRATQAGAYVGVRLLVPPCLTKEVQCWRIERTDGQVFRYTAHDMPVRIGAEVYSPCASLTASALELSAEYAQTDNMDLSGIISDGGITYSDMFAGRFDGAQVAVYRAAWDGSAPAVLIAAGKCAGLTYGTTGFQFEITTAGERLSQRPILQAVTATCRFKLGDSRCSIDLEALRVSGSVTTLSGINIESELRRRVFQDTSRAEADNYFQLGRLTWTTGDNAGISVDVKRFVDDWFTLEQPMQFDIELGDTYTIVPGCDRLFTTCHTKFANAINFGGYPHLRGTDDLGYVPPVKE